MLPRYADIIIDISHEAIDRPFQYRIPDELQEKIQIGSMVKIPFGRGNHLRTGYVIGFRIRRNISRIGSRRLQNFVIGRFRWKDDCLRSLHGSGRTMDLQ